jgi:uncharacterized protein (TIGR02266 family)
MGLSIQKTKVLLVDDDELCRGSLLRQLDSQEILQAESYQQAQAILNQTFVDIVVTDNAMPTRNGLDVLRLVAQLQPQAVRVMFSGNPPKNLHQLLDAGLIHQFFAKPADGELIEYLVTVRRGEQPAPNATAAAPKPEPAPAPAKAAPPPPPAPAKAAPPKAAPAKPKAKAAPPPPPPPPSKPPKAKAAPPPPSPAPAKARPTPPPSPAGRPTPPASPAGRPTPLASPAVKPAPPAQAKVAPPPPPPRREPADSAAGETMRRDKRHPTSRLVEVHCKTWKQFIRVYIQDISRGGMFLASNEPPPVDSELEIRIVPPGGDSLTLTARVVHILTEEVAAAQNRKPGVGVAFQDLDEDQQRHVQALVQIARLNQESARKVSQPPSPPPVKRDPTPPPSSKIKEAPKKAEASSDLRVEEILGEEQRGKTGTYSIVSDFAIEKIREHIEHKRYRQAERQLEAIVNEQPYNARAQILLFLVQARQLKVDGKLEQAIAKYQAVLELDEGNAEAVREVRAFHRSKRGSKGFLSRVLSRKES